jgi:hypothetical protein
MTDLVVTAANVLEGTAARKQTGVAGSTITQGQSVFVDSSGQLQPAQKDVDAGSAAAVGIALTAAEAGQPVVYQSGGEMDVGATLAVGETYVVGAAGGGIAPIADLLTTEFATILGIATAAGVLKLGILQSGVAHV